MAALIKGGKTVHAPYLQADSDRDKEIEREVSVYFSYVHMFSVFFISSPYHIISSPLLFLRLLPNHSFLSPFLFSPPLFSTYLSFSLIFSHPLPSFLHLTSHLSSISPLLPSYLTSHLTSLHLSHIYSLLLFSPYSLSHLISLTSSHLTYPLFSSPISSSCSMKQNELEQRELNSCDYTNSIN